MKRTATCHIVSIKQHYDPSEPTRVVEIKIRCERTGLVRAFVEPDYGVLRHFEVEPTGKDFGKVAYSLVEAYLAKQGCQEVSLTAISPRVEHFWRTLGFIGHVEMRKNITHKKGA